MKKIAAVGLGACAIALAFAAKDPVIMKVNGVDVPKSEFEYLYNKNSQQQINPQTLEEYVEMFKIYKMKVADAKAEGLDTMQSFLKETEQYRHELAAPYLADSVYMNKLVDEAYDRSKEEVEAIHIMFFKSRNPKENPALRMRADSIRTLLLNGEDFAELAKKYSMDRGSKDKGGRMGYISVNNYPIAFELAAFNTPEGEISEVVESPQGYHILKGGKHRPARGKVQVAHILRLTQGMDDAAKASVKKDIDSLYRMVVANPDSFNVVATKKSEDRGSARQGGVLPWFGTGEMVEQFDSVAFAIPVGAISEPVETAYGYHIIKKLGERGVPSKESIKPMLLSRISSPQDVRFKQIRDNQNRTLAKKHKGSLNAKTLAAIRRYVSKNGIDSMLYQNWTTVPTSEMVLASVDGKTSKVKDFAESLKGLNIEPSIIADDMLNDKIDEFYNQKLVNAEEGKLEKEQPDYRNLLKEYVDGSLLYEVSVRKVWDKAAKDTEGLEKYFAEHKDNYKWTDPHAKGFLVQAANDSVAQLIKDRVATLDRDSVVNTIRKEFSGQATADRVLVSKGTNAMVDNILFGGPVVTPSAKKYQVYFMIDPRLITEPEELSDVKGLVTSDYQNELQAAWENELKMQYPVVVDEKVLKTVKRVNQ